MKRVFVIYAEIPEDIKFFSGEVDELDFETLVAWNGKFINAMNQPMEPETLEDVLRKLYPVEPPTILTEIGEVTIFHTGFIL